jgi:hypothetical protein
MGPNQEGIVTEADIRSAQAFIDAWLESTDSGDFLTHGARLELRGMLAGHLADVRTAGYLAGEQAGRRQAGQLVRDLIESEGL